MREPTASARWPGLVTPRPELRSWVAGLWVSSPGNAGVPGPLRREHALPTGQMHLVFRLSERPLRIGAAGCEAPSRGSLEPMPAAAVGGARSRYYLRELHGPSASVGVLLRPGASLPLVGAPADELASAHWNLADLWGTAAAELQQRLLESAEARQQLDLVQTMLLHRLEGRSSRLRPTDALIRAELAELDRGGPIAASVARTGLSHRAFVDAFRRLVGLSPKSFSRVRRLQRVLIDLKRGPDAPSLAQVAADHGFADQAHLCRDVLDLTGVSPGEYRRRRPRQTNHLPA